MENSAGTRSDATASVHPIGSQPGMTGDSRIEVNFAGLAQRVLDGHGLTEAEGLAIVATPDEELLELMAAAYRIRRHFFGNRVHLHFLINAKSGLCPEDCSYCSQSPVSRAEIPKYNLLNREQLMDGARVAAERGSRTYCIVISARSPNERELREVEALVPEIKRQYGVRICTSLGLLNDDQARRLKACGVDRINHNVNTGADYYAEICSTHSYRDRVETLRAVREAGLEICSGGIIGMGEHDIDVVRHGVGTAATERTIDSDQFPASHRRHALAGLRELNPRRCLKTLALSASPIPPAVRMAAGRELHLGSMQCLGLYAANSLFVGDYLTTKGQPPEADYRMLEEMGFVITEQAIPR